MLPIDLVLVRHGQSEGNVARNLSEQGDDSLFTERFMSRHSSKYRLTNLGRLQAVAARDWIKVNFSGHFDRHEVSPYLRAMETAALLDLPDADWRLNDYLRERDCGDWDNISETLKKDLYAAAYHRYSLDPFRWQPPGGGESVAQMCMRVDRVIDTWDRHCRDQAVIATCHGLMMWGFVIRIERLVPAEFLRRTKMSAHKIRNCQIIHYTRRDPATGRVSDHADWVRFICPWDLPGSDMSWRRIERPRFSNQDLFQMVSESPRLVS
jgi:broad specificity phosphatase PhoE